MTDTMKLWDAVSKTNPANTKAVNQRGGFTAINANSQIMEATRQFGPIGVGWGYDAGDPIFHDNLMFVQVALWHGERANRFGPMLGCEEWKDGKGRLDSDAGKKATTDAITKLLSQLGFNADVFLGLYDDQKYVDQVRSEFAANAAPPYDLELKLVEITACDTLMALKRWWKDNGGAVPEAYQERIVAAIDDRTAAINTMDRSVA